MPKRPYADLYNVLGTTTHMTLRGRLVMESGDVDLDALTPAREFSQRELRGVNLQVSLKGGGSSVDLQDVVCDDEGYLQERFDLAQMSLSPGSYELDVFFEGEAVGLAQVRLLGDDFDDCVIRSDIDKTYLDTRFKRSRDALKLLFQNAEERAVLTGMAHVYRALQAGRSGDAARPLVFLSGSPRFFKRVLERRIEMDGLVQHGVFLKPFKEIASRTAASLSVGSVVPELKEQVGYKLQRLLLGRLDLPRRTREILMGDDSEADFVVYNLYTLLISGDLSVEALSESLTSLGVAAVWRDQIASLAPAVVGWVERVASVEAIYINKTGTKSERHLLERWSIEGVTHVHLGAWPLMLDLLEEGRVSASAVGQLWVALKAQGEREDRLLLNAFEAYEAGYIDLKTFETYHIEEGA